MAVRIRLVRQGAKKHPEYLIVATDQAKKRDGKFLEKIGYYKPSEKTAAAKVTYNEAAWKSWLAKGAQPSQTVGQLIKSLSK